MSGVQRYRKTATILALTWEGNDDEVPVEWRRHLSVDPNGGLVVYTNAGPARWPRWQ